MSEKADPNEISSLQDLLLAQMIQIDTLTLMLIEKNVFTQDEFFAKLKEVKAEYESRKRRSS
jgi:hypothetical protein